MSKYTLKCENCAGTRTPEWCPYCGDGERPVDKVTVESAKASGSGERKPDLMTGSYMVMSRMVGSGWWPRDL